MQRERWQRIKEVANACLELDRGQWESHIREACHDDHTLLSEVNSLLASYDNMGDFLAFSVVEDEREVLPAGRRVGMYEIREPIAEGGMGIVYRAIRTADFEKQVAVKVVKRGMDTNFILQRFREERQILAALEHPNIARLLDGGATDDGRPYLVMEYVEGQPINRYADDQALNLSERLELFRTVCSAVQHAHQNLVVHRDLKPGNILVTADGVPKLLDFGIAKLLESDADVTAASLRLMTPECASPEQVCGQVITTATDIYSLGVLLYELLTNSRPYRFTTRTPEEIRRLICEEEPAKPSMVRRLPEELDNIVLKAMDKDPARRYVSAEQFSEDLRCFQQGLPVRARAGGGWYRARKFVVRHKGASLTAAAVALSLVAGMGATLWEANQARTARASAERRFNDVRALSNSLIFEVQDAIRTLPGSMSARKLIVDRGLQYLDRLEREAGSDNSLRRELAAAYVKMGQVQGQIGVASLGDDLAAIRSLRKAVKLFEQIAATGGFSAADERVLASGYDTLGDALWNTGDRTRTQECERKALSLRQHLARQVTPLEAAKELALSYHQMGLHRAEAGDFQAALENHQKFLDACERIARAEPDSAYNQRQLSLAHKRVGALQIKLGRLNAALAHYRLAQTLDESRLAADPGNAEARMDLTFAESDIGYILREQGNWRAALAQYRKAEAVRSELAAADPRDQRSRSSLATTYEFIARIQWHLGRRARSLDYYRKALALIEPLLASNPASQERRTDAASVYLEVGDACADIADAAGIPHTGRTNLWRQARNYYQRAGQLTAAASGGETADTNRRARRQLLLAEVAIKRLAGSVAPQAISLNLPR